MQVSSVHMVVARAETLPVRFTQRNLIEEFAAGVQPEPQARRRDRNITNSVTKAERLKHVGSVRAHLDSGPDLAKLARALKHANAMTLLEQHGGGRQSAKPGARNENISFHSGPACCHATALSRSSNYGRCVDWGGNVSMPRTHRHALLQELPLTRTHEEA